MEDKDRKVELERFAEILIRVVRDGAIAECDRLLSASTVGPDAERWRKLTADQGSAQAIREAIPDVVDETLFRLLDAIDNGQLPLAWRTTDGSFVGLDEVGLEEMAGWLMGSPGWRHAYSSQRFSDPFSSLKLDL
jgi:hypothetical protein